MLNQCVLVGRIVSLPDKINDNQYKLCLKVTQNYKDYTGNYVESFIDIKLLAKMAQQVTNYCGIDDVIGIKGYIDTDVNGYPTIISTKVTFLSSNPEAYGGQSESLIDDSGEI